MGLTTDEQIKVRFFNDAGCQIVPEGKGNSASIDDSTCYTKPTDPVCYTLYDITIKPNILYQDHPALARKEDGTYRYHQIQADGGMEFMR